MNPHGAPFISRTAALFLTLTLTLPGSAGVYPTLNRATLRQEAALEESAPVVKQDFLKALGVPSEVSPKAGLEKGIRLMEGGLEEVSFDRAVLQALNALQQGDPTLIGIEMYLSPSRGILIRSENASNVEAISKQAMALVGESEKLTELLREGRFVVETGVPMYPGSAPQELGARTWEAVRVVVIKPADMLEVERAIRNALQYFLLFRADYEVLGIMGEAMLKKANPGKVKQYARQNMELLRLKQSFFPDYRRSAEGVLAQHRPNLYQELRRLQKQIGQHLGKATPRLSPGINLKKGLKVTQMVLRVVDQIVATLRNELSAGLEENETKPDGDAGLGKKKVGEMWLPRGGKRFDGYVGLEEGEAIVPKTRWILSLLEPGERTILVPPARLEEVPPVVYKSAGMKLALEVVAAVGSGRVIDLPAGFEEITAFWARQPRTYGSMVLLDVPSGTERDWLPAGAEEFAAVINLPSSVASRMTSRQLAGLEEAARFHGRILRVKGLVQSEVDLLAVREAA